MSLAPYTQTPPSEAQLDGFGFARTGSEGSVYGACPIKGRIEIYGACPTKLAPATREALWPLRSSHGAGTASDTINEREVHAGFAAHDSKRICKAVGAQARRLRSGEFSAMTLGEWVPIRWYSAELDEQGKLTIDRENWRRRHTPAEVVELRWIHGDAEDALVELRTEEAIRLGADRVTNDRP